MNIPSDAFYAELKARKETNFNRPEDYRFMNRSELRDSLAHSYFPYNRQITRALFKDKHIMFIGDSLVRAMYKDMLSLLQTGDLCTVNDLRVSNEDSIFGDKHIDFLELEANRVFRQAREFQSNRHLIQYFFTNRAMREDLEKTCLMMEATEEKPDVVVINSAIWDVSRFPARLSQRWSSAKMDDLEEEINVAEEYLNRIAMFCRRMRVLLPPSSTVVWLIMPPSSTPDLNTGGFMNNNHLKFHEIRMRLLEANVRAAQVVREAGFDVLDLSFHFRTSNYQVFRIKDGVHFNTIATRYMNQLLIGHIVGAWRLTDNVYKRWAPRINNDNTKSKYYNAALQFLEDRNELKHKNEEIHQHLRSMAFEGLKIRTSKENSMDLEELDNILRTLLMFYKFDSRSQSEALGHVKAFAGAIPIELSRFSQEDIEEIQKMIQDACQDWKGHMPCLKLSTTHKRDRDTAGRVALLPTPPQAPPGVSMYMNGPSTSNGVFYASPPNGRYGIFNGGFPPNGVSNGISNGNYNGLASGSSLPLPMKKRRLSESRAEY